MAKEDIVIEIKVNHDKLQHQRQIAGAASDVRRDQAVVDGLIDKIQLAAEKLPEWDELQNAAAAVEVARENFNRAASRSQGINDLKEELAAARHDLRDSKFGLSGLLVGYVAKYQERSLTVEHQHRQIDVTAKLGKAIDKQEVLAL